MRTLAPCPASPNCVSSQATDPRQSMAPLPFDGDAGEAQRRLEDMVRALPRTRIVHSEPGYFSAQCRSLIFRFVDDVEFSIDAQAHVVHFRSASRTGYSDFGVNRKRMQAIADAFAVKPR